jgi:hypothetical protein
MNEPYKLDRFSVVSLTHIVKCNTLFYCAHPLVTKKIKCCKYGPWILIMINLGYLLALGLSQDQHFSIKKPEQGQRDDFSSTDKGCVHDKTFLCVRTIS